jgi:site-specific recombinase XerD
VTSGADATALAVTTVDFSRLEATGRRTALQEAELAAIIANAKRLRTKARSEATWKAYRSDWRQFEAYCEHYKLPALPTTTKTLASFLSSQAGQDKAPSTIQRRLISIRVVHKGSGYPPPDADPAIGELMKGIRRDATRLPKKKKATLPDDITKMADTATERTRKGLRDRALLLFGFAGAFRRAELVAIDIDHLDFVGEGVRVTLPSSKTDQEGQGQMVAIPAEPGVPHCPVQALKDWITVGEIRSGPVFLRMYKGDSVGKTPMTPQSVALLVKDHAERAGLEPAHYAGHSLRRGFLTTAAKERKNLFKMAEHSRHRSLETVREYVEDASKFDDHAGKGLLEVTVDRDDG